MDAYSENKQDGAQGMILTSSEPRQKADAASPVSAIAAGNSAQHMEKAQQLEQGQPTSQPNPHRQQTCAKAQAQPQQGCKAPMHSTAKAAETVSRHEGVQASTSDADRLAVPQTVQRTPQPKQCFAAAQGRRRRVIFSRRKRKKLFAVSACVIAVTVVLCGTAGLLFANRTAAQAVYSKAVVSEKPSQAAQVLLQSPAQRLAAQPFLTLFNESNPIADDFQLTLAKVGNTSFEMQSEAAQQLAKMLQDGAAQGLRLIIRSTYRSHEQQQANFNRKLSGYLAQGLSLPTAEEYTRASIATPGKSEHETGLAADVASSSGQILGPWFAQTAEYAWLIEHCAEYGFILRYPENRQDVTGVYYEPWHYRYVGTQYAAEIAASGLTLEEFLAAVQLTA